MTDDTVGFSSIRIHLLGRFHVSVDGSEVDDSRWQRRRSKALVKILALEPRHQLHREQLMELLWPESTADAAAKGLNKVVHGARRTLEPALRKGSDSRFLRRQSDLVILSSPGELWVDVSTFEALAAEAIELDTIGAYDTALGYYSGDLLEEDLYEAWLSGKRDKLRLVRQQLTSRLALRYENDGRLEESIASWNEVLRVEPENEGAHRSLMCLYMRTGHRQQALLQYERCRQVIGDELGVEVEEATSRLHDDILNGRFKPRERDAVAVRSNSEDEIDAIAVLPFENASGDPALAYFCEGITDSLINGLAQLPGLRVMARSTVFRHRGAGTDPQEVGRKLDVQGIVVGRVAQWTERLLVGAELIRVGDGSLLWGENFNRASTDIFAVQDEISQSISQRLRLKLTSTDKARLEKRHTHDTEAYQHYLKGRFHWGKRTGASLERALTSFSAAIEADPEYALAYAGLADCHNVLSLYSIARPREAMPKAKEAANRALAIDETLAEAHAALAYCKLLYDWDWVGAEQGFQRAIALNSGYATAYHWYHVCLNALGRFDAAAEQLRTAKNLDPLSLIINTELGWGLYLARQYDSAIEHLERTLDMDPHFAVAHLILGMAQMQLGRFDRAVSEIEKAIDLQAEVPFVLAIGALGHAYARNGDSKLALKTIKRLDDLSKSLYVSAYTRALVHTGLENIENALEGLERAVEERYDRLIFLNVEPMFDVLRPHPRFARLIRQLELA